MILNLQVKIKIEDLDTENAIARIHYPNEGNFITITKGLNVIELSDAIYHEIGHLIDWYVSNENQSKDVEIREDNANLIGECLRFRESSNEAQTNEYGVPNNPPIKMGENVYGFNFKRMEIIKSTVNEPYYAIGIDAYDKNNLCYCLSRKIGAVVEILLCKTMSDEDRFKEEVENIAKYFNAEIFREI